MAAPPLSMDGQTIYAGTLHGAASSILGSATPIVNTRRRHHGGAYGGVLRSLRRAKLLLELVEPTGIEPVT